MDGRATPTMETSRASRNRAPHKTTRVPQRRGFQRYSAAGAIVVAVMIAPVCMYKHYVQSNLMRLHLASAQRSTPLMTPRQAGADLAEAGAGLAGAAEAGAGLAGAAEAGAGLARAAEAGAGLARAAEAGGPPLVSAWRSLSARPPAVSAPPEREPGHP